MNRKLLYTALAFTAFGAGACTEGYPPYVRLESLRVLAIQSEPVAPGAGETTTLTPLIYVPDAQPVTYAWSWCPVPGSANQGFPCLATPAQVAAQFKLDLAALPPSDLGTGPTAQFPVTFDPSPLKALCKPTEPGAASGGGMPRPMAGGIPGFAQQDCRDGFPIQIKLDVRKGAELLTTVRTLRLRLDPNAPPNSNPTLNGLVAELPSEADGGAPDVIVPFDELGTVLLRRQTETVIKAVAPEGLSEPYLDLNEQDLLVPANERLFISWFVESGRTSPGQTGFIPGATGTNDPYRTEWIPGGEKVFPRNTSRIIVVIRDNRGGVGWVSGSATLGAAK